MTRTELTEMRAAVWNMAMKVDKLRKQTETEEGKRIADITGEHLKEAHLALYCLQLELDQGERK